MSVSKIVLLGAGRVASSLAWAIDELSGYSLVQIYSRQLDHAKRLTTRLSSAPIALNNLEHIVRDADLYIYALPDDALPKAWYRMPRTSGTWIHMSGGIPIDTMVVHHTDVAVIYPLQTFSHDRKLQWSDIPLFVESTTEQSTVVALDLAHALSRSVQRVDSYQRCQIHIAGVIANNFTNHLITLSQEYLKRAGISPNVITPILIETFSKLGYMPAYKAQTGPACRGDQSTIERHIAMLADRPELCHIYKLLSDSISKRYNEPMSQCLTNE